MTQYEPIIEAVRKEFLQPHDYMTGKSKLNVCTTPRQITCKIIKDKFGWRSPKKGFKWSKDLSEFMGKNPKTIYVYTKYAEMKIEKSPLLKKRYNNILKELDNEKSHL